MDGASIFTFLSLFFFISASRIEMTACNYDFTRMAGMREDPEAGLGSHNGSERS